MTYPSLIVRLSFAYPSLILRLSFAHCSLIVCRWEGREGWEGWGE